MNLLSCLIKAKAGMIRNNTKVNLGKQTAIIFYHQERTYQQDQKDYKSFRYNSWQTI